MPFNCEDLPTRTRLDFCVALKAARERKGLSLAEIATATKIPASLFAGLERNDLRHWPNGIYRRSFFRDYARIVGLPEAAACAEFQLLFADGTPAPPAATAGDVTPADLRLTLDAPCRESYVSSGLRLAAAAVDITIIVLGALAIAWMANIDRTSILAATALSYFSAATLMVGGSPAQWAVSKRATLGNALRRGAVRLSTSIQRDHHANGARAEDEAEPAPWISDAHRVGPSAQLRFRVKTSP